MSLALAAGLALLLAPSPGGAGLPVSSDLCVRPGSCGQVLGTVQAGGQRTPVADVAVLAVPASSRRLKAVLDPASDRPAWLRQARTGPDGRLALDTPPGLVRLVIVAPGFERFEAVIEVRAGATTPVKLFPRPLELNPYRTVVRAPPETARVPDVAARTLSREEIATLPGSQGDPLRALQNLPGVARTPGGLGLLVLRGASPNQSQVFVGEHPVPRAFHVLSLASVVPADVIDRIDFVPGNFDSRYGNATGGVVVIEPRRGRRDGLHGFAELDLAAASALVEGPVGKRGGSFVVAAQRAYIDGVLLAAQKVLGRQDLLLPRYWDYQAMFDHPLPGGGTISARVIGSGDRIRLRGDDYATGESRLVFDFRSDFHRVDVVVRKRLGPWRFMVSPAFRFQLGRSDLPQQMAEQYRRDYVTSLRAEGVRAVAERLELVFGTDLQLDAYTAQTIVLNTTGVGDSPRMTQNTRGVETWVGAYTTARLRLGPLLLTPGVRASGFVVGAARAFAVDPRLNARLDIAERWSLRAGVGLYSQPRVVRYAADGRIVPGATRLGTDNLIVPSFFSNFEPVITFAPLEDTLRVSRALQASATVAHELLSGVGLEFTGFWREQDNAVPPRIDDQILPAVTTRNYGLELLLRRPLTRRLYGWLAYTAMRSQSLVAALGPDPAERYPADFDQRHNLAVVASFKLRRGWQVGGRFRLVSGTPYTPLLGAVQFEGTFQPITGVYNSARFPPFHQLDLRVDRRWILRRTSVTAYLDVQNVYNHNNVEAYLYNYDYTSKVGGIGLPIFPSIGVRVDY